MVKQRQKSKAYKQFSSKDKGSDSDGEETELFVRKKSPKKEIPSVEKNVEEGDTLQSLAIRYHCAVEELKRLNNIHKENEIYARRTIKVPYRPFSEVLISVHHSGASSPQTGELIDLNEPTTSKLVDIGEIEKKLEDVIRLQEVTPKTPVRTNLKDSQINEIIFNSSIQKTVPDRLETYHDNPQADSEEFNLLPQRSAIFEPDPIVNTVSKLNCNGSDWDISLPILIVCIVVVIVAAPIIWVFYVAEHPEEYRHHNDIVGGVEIGTNSS